MTNTKENKIYNNPNKIISRLPININTSKQLKTCFGLIGNQVKLKLIEPVYLHPESEDIVQTFLYLFNNNEGKGVFVQIIKNKIKDWIVFCNESKSLITKDELDIANKFKIIIEGLIKKPKPNLNLNLMFFINLGNYPVIHKKLYIEDKKKFIPVVSFTSSYNNYDIPLPIPKIHKIHKNIVQDLSVKSKNKLKSGILFIFEKRKIEEKDSPSNKIFNRILELKKHPYYKHVKLDYIQVDGINNFKKIEIGKVNVIISDPYVPIYYQFLLNSNTQIVLIENLNYYSYYSKLLIPDEHYSSWSIDTWEMQMDKFIENKKIIKSLNNWAETNITIDNFKDKYLGFLEHLNLNYSKSEIMIEPFSNYNETNFNITTQLDYDKFFNLLYKNFKLIRCYSYRLNPYSSLLTKLKTSHTFVPELIKLSLTSLEPYENLHWISQRRVQLDFLPQILSNAKSIQVKQKKFVTNIFSHIVNNSDDLLNLKIINNISSLFYIELPPSSSKFNLWENDFVSELESILQFINEQPEGTSFIVRIFTFQLPRTLGLIHNFQSKFEKIKIIKNEWFDSYLPYRYLVGINHQKNKLPMDKTILDLETYNQVYFSLETQELIKVIKYVKSDANVEIETFLNLDLINGWINKWFSSTYF